MVDQSGSTRFGEPVTKAALAVEVAAVLALAAAYHNDRVGALLFADEVERVIPPRKGRRHALRVIRDLVAFEPAGRRTNLAASLSYASRLLRHRSIVVVLSDFIAEGWERPLRRLAARHEVVAITVDDPREHDLPDSGWIELEDAETGRRVLVDTGSREVRARVKRARRPAAGGAGARARRCRRRSRAARDRQRLRAPAPPRLRAARAPHPSRMIAGVAARGRQSRRRRPSVTRSGSAATVAVPPGRTVRAADWEPAGSGRAARPASRARPRRLGRDRLSGGGLARRASTPSIAPGRCCSGPTVRVDSLPPQTFRITDRERAARAAPRTPASGRSRAPLRARGARSPLPVVIALLLAAAAARAAALVVAAARAAAAALRRADTGGPATPPLDRWADAGESRAVAAAATGRLRAVLGPAGARGP